VALIKTNPDARLVLIGNSDIVGTDDAKYELSVRRADALANWLVLNNVTSLDKIQIRGAGDLNPIVKDARSELQALNRRVDLRIDCPKE
jgi:outer membrane protein OmpA-like peptidoglycan-associated protein